MFYSYLVYFMPHWQNESAKIPVEKYIAVTQQKNKNKNQYSTAMNFRHQKSDNKPTNGQIYL